MGNTMETLAEPVTDRVTVTGSLPTTTSQTRSNNRKKKDIQQSKPTIYYAVSSMQGWRATMEDSHTLCPSLQIPPTNSPPPPLLSTSSSSTSSSSPLPSKRHQQRQDHHNHQQQEQINLLGHALFGLYDGHGGDFSSQYAGEHAVRVFTQREELKRYASLSPKERADVPGVELLRIALLETFMDMDSELAEMHSRRVMDAKKQDQGKKRRSGSKSDMNNVTDEIQEARSRKMGNSPNCSSPVPTQEEDINNLTASQKLDRSGTTAVVTLITPTHILCANAGDSRCILRRSSTVYPLSFDHKPNDLREQNRIADAGGDVRMKRVDGDLAVSRGLGDFRFKSNPSLSAERQKVTARPDIMVMPRDEGEDEFLVLACDGVWDVLGNDECAGLIKGLIDEGETDVGLICEEIVDTCLEKDSRDNMTACVVAFPRCGLGRKKAGGHDTGTGVVMARRARRRATGITPGKNKIAKNVAKSAAQGVAQVAAGARNVKKVGSPSAVAPASPTVRVKTKKSSKSIKRGKSTSMVHNSSTMLTTITNKVGPETEQTRI